MLPNVRWPNSARPVGRPTGRRIAPPGSSLPEMEFRGYARDVERAASWERAPYVAGAAERARVRRWLLEQLRIFNSAKLPNVDVAVGVLQKLIADVDMGTNGDVDV